MADTPSKEPIVTLTSSDNHLTIQNVSSITFGGICIFNPVNGLIVFKIIPKKNMHSGPSFIVTPYNITIIGAHRINTVDDSLSLKSDSNDGNFVFNIYTNFNKNKYGVFADVTSFKAPIVQNFIQNIIISVAKALKNNYETPTDRINHAFNLVSSHFNFGFYRGKPDLYDNTINNYPLAYDISQYLSYNLFIDFEFLKKRANDFKSDGKKQDLLIKSTTEFKESIGGTDFFNLVLSNFSSN